LRPSQQVISLLVAENEQQSVLTATENGFGKRSPIVEYTRHGRGTQGMIAIKTSERNGKVVAATLVDPDDEIMLIGTKRRDDPNPRQQRYARWAEPPRVSR